MSSSSVKYTAAGIMGVAVILALASVWHDSIVVDEDPHIGAGYSYIEKQDMRLNPEHPPLAKDLAGIPLLFLNLKQDAFQTKFWQTDVNGQWEFGRRLIYNSGNNADLIAHVVKIAMMLFFVVAGWLVFRWTRERYGDKAGLLALTLFAFSPTVMAHARFVTTDVAALVGVLAATYTFVRYLKNPTRNNFWLAAVVFGIALLTKFSTILLVPFFVLLALLWHWRTIHKTLLLMFLGLLVVVGPVYFFHTFNYPPIRQHADTKQLLQAYGNRMLADPIVWASDKPIIRAYAEYGLGVLLVVQRSAGGNMVYYRGEVLNAGGPGYFPFVYAIKEPLPWLILLAIAILATLAKIKIKKSKWKVLELLRNNFDETAMLLWLVIYWATSIHSTLNIGVRHLMPVYPFMIILVSGQLAGLADRMRNYELGIRNGFKKIIIHNSLFIIPLLLCWYVIENLAVFPSYLTYFNQLVGGPSGGYRYVVDSNLDWGQDLRRIADYVNDHDIKKIELDYFGWADQYYYLGNHFDWLTSDKYKNKADFLARSDSNGWIAVSATFLMNNFKTKYAWLYAERPVTVIGNSIFVYHLSL